MCHYAKQIGSYLISVVPQKDSFGDLVGSMGMPPPVQPVPVANGETKSEEIDTSPGKDSCLNCSLFNSF